MYARQFVTLFSKNLAQQVAALFSAGEQGVWFDPSDFATMFQDSAGTTPVTAAGQPVGKILDKSGRGNHAIQATAANRPTLQQDASGYLHLLFDGSNDSLATASIDFTGTDKIALWTGVRKLSDAAPGTIAELSAGIGSNPGTFRLDAASLAGNYRVNLRGDSAGACSWLCTTFTAPITNILSAYLNIGGTARADEVLPRVNAAIPTLTAAGNGSAGIGNLGNFPLYIGATAGTSVFFNGRLYSLIGRGAATSAAQILLGDTYANSKTGAY